MENLIFEYNLICFLLIVECDAAQNCNSQGICGKDGSCECDWGFFMDDCSSKNKLVKVLATSAILIKLYTYFILLLFLIRGLPSSLQMQ